MIMNGEALGMLLFSDFIVEEPRKGFEAARINHSAWEDEAKRVSQGKF
jgi:hypothetical protein